MPTSENKIEVWKWIAGALLACIMWFIGGGGSASGIETELRQHEAAPGHQISITLLTELNRRVGELEKQVNEQNKVLQEILLELRETDRQQQR